ELHDDTVQVLAAMLMRVRMLTPANPSLERFEEMLAGALERTRKLMFELRPQLLEHEGLGSALRALAQDGPWSEAAVDVDVPRQSVEMEAIAYRAIRELIINARKHSQASRLEVTGGQIDGTLVFTVADDGVGFDPDIALARSARVMHLGLDATIERVRLAGGEFVIDARPGHGSRFRVTLPAEPLH
ncbi:MAG TPA: ATP-binding protein, partial [Thermoleophilia bacterium]|nr:ATP-binding protein [Thermoleophilia bacterium]